MEEFEEKIAIFQGLEGLTNEEIQRRVEALRVVASRRNVEGQIAYLTGQIRSSDDEIREIDARLEAYERSTVHTPNDREQRNRDLARIEELQRERRELNIVMNGEQNDGKGGVRASMPQVPPELADIYSEYANLSMEDAEREETRLLAYSKVREPIENARSIINAENDRANAEISAMETELSELQAQRDAVRRELGARQENRRPGARIAATPRVSSARFSAPIAALNNRIRNARVELQNNDRISRAEEAIDFMTNPSNFERINDMSSNELNTMVDGVERLRSVTIDTAITEERRQAAPSVEEETIDSGSRAGESAWGRLAAEEGLSFEQISILETTIKNALHELYDNDTRQNSSRLREALENDVAINSLISDEDEYAIFAEGLHKAREAAGEDWGKDFEETAQSIWLNWIRANREKERGSQDEPEPIEVSVHIHDIEPDAARKVVESATAVKPAEVKPAEEKPVEDKPAEEKPAEAKPAEETQPISNNRRLINEAMLSVAQISALSDMMQACSRHDERKENAKKVKISKLTTEECDRLIEALNEARENAGNNWKEEFPRICKDILGNVLGMFTQYIDPDMYAPVEEEKEEIINEYGEYVSRAKPAEESKDAPTETKPAEESKDVPVEDEEYELLQSLFRKKPEMGSSEPPVVTPPQAQPIIDEYIFEDFPDRPRTSRRVPIDISDEYMPEVDENGEEITYSLDSIPWIQQLSPKEQFELKEALFEYGCDRETFDNVSAYAINNIFRRYMAKKTEQEQNHGESAAETMKIYLEDWKAILGGAGFLITDDKERQTPAYKLEKLISDAEHSEFMKQFKIRGKLPGKLKPEEYLRLWVSYKNKKCDELVRGGELDAEMIEAIVEGSVMEQNLIEKMRANRYARDIQVTKLIDGYKERNEGKEPGAVTKFFMKHETIAGVARRLPMFKGMIESIYPKLTDSPADPGEGVSPEKARAAAYREELNRTHGGKETGERSEQRTLLEMFMDEDRDTEEDIGEETDGRSDDGNR